MNTDFLIHNFAIVGLQEIRLITEFARTVFCLWCPSFTSMDHIYRGLGGHVTVILEVYWLTN